MKRMYHFNNVDKWLKNRQREVQKNKLGWEDSWATDKKWKRENIDGFFSCKFCAQPLYTYSYEPGVINVTCNTPLCPGNADHDMKDRAKLATLDIRKMTNQYLFDSMLRF